MPSKTIDSYTSSVTCTSCGATTAMRSHRKHFYEFLRTRLTGKVPFRCSDCGQRFWLTIDPRDL